MEDKLSPSALQESDTEENVMQECVRDLEETTPTILPQEIEKISELGTLILC
jgi:hypothetical protein